MALTWEPATNQAAGSGFQVWVGSAASHNYSRHYPAPTNGFVFTADMLDPGLNYVCISQISQTESALNISGLAASGLNVSGLTASELDVTGAGGPGTNVSGTNNYGVTASGPAIDVSAFSGEVQILKAQWVTAAPVVTNETIEVSTNLGQSWQCTGTNQVTVPVSEAAQRFFRARANFTVTLVRTNLLSLPPAP